MPLKPIDTLLQHSDAPGPCWRLSNRYGASVFISSWGATILEIKVPDRHGQLHDVVLGYAQHCDYKNNRDMFGCVVGPFANRIANGEFLMGERRVRVQRNLGNHHLHGGSHGLHHQLWQCHEHQVNADCVSLTLRCPLSADESGYPADYEFQVRYQWNDQQQLTVSYQARANRDTIVNLTQHSYFNLAGTESIASILEHQLWLAGDHVCEVDKDLIPTGQFSPVENTALDFQRLTRIRDNWNLNSPALSNTGGLDHNWLTEKTSTPTASEQSLPWIAALYEPQSQRHLKVFSDQPGIQVYSGNFLNVDNGKYGQHYSPYTGICLETQHFPDSPNHAHFPSTKLNAGDCFHSTSVYEFGVGEIHIDG